MEDKELIKQIMDEVKDPTLRDSLLKKVAGSPVVAKIDDPTVIDREIEKLGFNPGKAREAVRAATMFGIFKWLLIGAGFFILGLFGLFGGLSTGDGAQIGYGVVFMVAGLILMVIGEKALKASKPAIEDKELDPLGYE